MLKSNIKSDISQLHIAGNWLQQKIMPSSVLPYKCGFVSNSLETFAFHPSSNTIKQALKQASKQPTEQATRHTSSIMAASHHWTLADVKKSLDVGQCWELNPVSKLLLAPDCHQQSNTGPEQANNQVTNQAHAQACSQPGTQAALWQPAAGHRQ